VVGQKKRPLSIPTLPLLLGLLCACNLHPPTCIETPPHYHTTITMSNSAQGGIGRNTPVQKYPLKIANAQGEAQAGAAGQFEHTRSAMVLSMRSRETGKLLQMIFPPLEAYSGPRGPTPAHVRTPFLPLCISVCRSQTLPRTVILAAEPTRARCKANSVQWLDYAKDGDEKKLFSKLVRLLISTLKEFSRCRD
jgi:hypothetical protein